MQQRQPRVGDIVDDYCPRERRLSDHAVVAMVGDDIRQTRCTTCDTEHEYRQGKMPAGRKKVAPPLPPRPPAGAAAGMVPPKPSEPESEADAPVPETVAGAPVAAAPPDAGAPVSPATAPTHEGSVHRRLIRAVLPRIEGEVPARQAPEFTMHTANQRPAHGRAARGTGGASARPGGRPHGHHTGASGGHGGFGSRGHGGHGAPGGHGTHGRGRPGPGGAHAQSGPRQGRSHGGGHGRKKS